jgi:NAD(P)-dependent dehydrogenase (short-subunit alcohol dehydrogenase family)
MGHGTHYAAAKAGVIGLTNNIAFEGEPHGILANAVLPFALTRMAAAAGEPEEGSLLGVSTTDTVSPLVVSSPAGTARLPTETSRRAPVDTPGRSSGARKAG